MAGESILVVDDHASNLKLLSVLLESRGYRVAGASNAEEALESLQDCRPAAVLLDLKLPGMDGFRLTRAIKDSPTMNTVKILALTAYAMVGDEERARDCGCDGYFTKPIDTRNFPSSLRDLLDQ